MNLLFGLAAVAALAAALALCAVVVRAIGWIRMLQALLVVGIALGTLSIITTVLDRPGLGVIGDTQPTVDAPLAFPVELGEQLQTSKDDDGRVHIAGRAPVELGEPVVARFTFLEPKTDQRVIWLLWQVTGSLLVVLGLLIVLLIVRSAVHGDPFVRANVRRLWSLAALFAVGGTGYSMLSGFAAVLMIQRSAAADLAVIRFTVEALPIMVGIAIAALASVWQVGVGLREDVEGMV